MKTLELQKLSYIIVNSISFILGIIAYIVSYQLDVKQVAKTGFFCNDVSIQYPYKEDTIKFVFLLLVGLAAGLLLILANEIIRYYYKQAERWQNNETQLLPKSTGEEEEQTPKTLARRIGIQAVIFVNGLTLTATVVCLCKLMIGQLRPNFLAVCRLKEGSYNCSDGFVTDYVCLQENHFHLADASHSFPSGHSTTAFYCMSFFVFYLDRCMPSRYWPVTKLTVQSLALILAIYAASTRLTDFKHHPSDVICGGLLGICFGYFTTRLLSTSVPFQARVTKKSYKSMEEVKNQA